MLTNYDQSSTGVNCEMSIYCDIDLSRMYFEDDFARIKGTDYLVYMPGECPGEVVLAPSDMIDWDSVSECDAESWAKDEGWDSLTGDGWDYDTYHDLVRDSIDDWETVASILKDDDGRFPLAYRTMTVRGYCQGDIATILYRDSDSFEGLKEFCRKVIYDCPIYACLEVDGREYRLDEHMDDTYQWNRDEAKRIIQGFDIPDTAKQWAIGNLPEYPDYV